MAVSTMREKTPGSISEAISACEENRNFQGHPETGESADITGVLPHERFQEPAMSGHPATESEGAEIEAEEKPLRMYSSHEEAERAAEQTQREIARLSAEINQTRDLALNVLSRGNQGVSEETPAPESAGAFAKRRRTEVLTEIEELDPDDENFKDKIAAAQAQADGDILERYREESANLEARRREESEGIQSVITQAERAMEEAGLDPARDSTDSIFFWSLAQLTPSEKDGVPVSMDDQIGHCIDMIKGYKATSLEAHKTGSKSKAGKGVTLSSVVDDIVECRRM